MFTPRVIGTAVARYNFAARDMRELSLREGDVVKIYSRIGGDQGWWKGETNGRVSSLPGRGPGLALLRGQGSIPLALTQADSASWSSASAMLSRDLGALSEISLLTWVGMKAENLVVHCDPSYTGQVSIQSAEGQTALAPLLSRFPLTLASVLQAPNVFIYTQLPFKRVKAVNS